MSAKHILDAARFLSKLSAKQTSSVTAKVQQLELDDGQLIPIHHYPASANKSNQGWILFLHGMNYAGHNEPRIVNLCCALAECGYNVLAPNINSIENFWIDFCSNKKIAQIVSAVKHSRQWDIDKKIALMSLSLTGTMAVHASADKQCADSLSGILLFGSFANSSSFIARILSNACVQDYPKLIMIKNLLHLAGKDKDLIKALHYFINDMYQKIDLSDSRSECSAYLQQINRRAVKKELMGIINTLNDTERYLQDYAKQIDYINSEFAKLDFPQELDFPVTLIHGLDDNTITFDESHALHSKLHKHHTKASVLVTPLIESHSNLKLSPKLLWDFLKLSSSIGSFLADAQRS
jgi:esterase/lipase